jgi:hypothetical protein
MDDAVPIRVDQTPAHILGRLLDDNVDALYRHRHGDPGTIREDVDFRLLSVEVHLKEVVRAGQLFTVIFGRPDSPEDGYKLGLTVSETPSQRVGKRPRRLDDDGIVDVAERHDDAGTFRVEEDVVEVKPTVVPKLRQLFGAGGMRTTRTLPGGRWCPVACAACAPPSCCPRLRPAFRPAALVSADSRERQQTPEARLLAVTLSAPRGPLLASSTAAAARVHRPDSPTAGGGLLSRPLDSRSSSRRRRS